MTTFRSVPCGRGGVGGTSPFAMRSVQSANISSTRLRPNWFRMLLIWEPAWPDWTRRSHAATGDGNGPSASGISRVPLLPMRMALGAAQRLQFC